MQECGCKGVRFCALCEATDRVKKLRVEEDKHAGYKVFVFDHLRQLAIPTRNLDSKSSLDEIIHGISIKSKRHI